MLRESHELLIELWAQLKSHIPVKERLEVADLIVTIFDEYGQIDSDILKEDTDNALRAALRSRLSEDEEGTDDDDIYDSDEY
jgi:hypothetical protein